MEQQNIHNTTNFYGILFPAGVFLGGYAGYTYAPQIVNSSERNLRGL